MIFPDFLDTIDKWNICVWNTKTVFDFENLLQKILKIENITVRDFYLLMKHLERDLNLCHQTQQFSSSVELVDLLVNLFYVFSTINTDQTELNQVIEQVISQINPVQLLGEDFTKKVSEDSVHQITEDKKVSEDSVDQVITQVIFGTSSQSEVQNFSEEYQETDQEFFDENIENIKVEVVENTKQVKKNKRVRKKKSENESGKSKKRKQVQSLV